MKTGIQTARTTDCFSDNDVLRLAGGEQVRGFGLAGMAWLTTGMHPREAHRLTLGQAASRLRTNLPDYSLWLLACHSVWQDDSPVTRHRRLWCSLEAGGLVLPAGRLVGECRVAAIEGVRYFGAMQLDASSLDDRWLDPVIAILKEEPASHLLALRRGDEDLVPPLIAKGWSCTSHHPRNEVLVAVGGAHGIVLWPIGAFDDREAGCVALGELAVLDQLMR